MDNITDVHLEKTDKSKYIQIQRVNYKQDGKQKVWDMILKHDSVSILIRHIERNSFIFVKQFRPAVYINQAKADGQDVTKSVDVSKTHSSKGVTYELCAGIVDKSLSLREIAKEEVLEEVGYDVPLDKLEKVITFRSGVGVSGAQMTLFYVEVTESMKAQSGGGNAAEGELIDVIEVPVKDSYDFFMNESKNFTSSVLFAVMWYFQNKNVKNECTNVKNE